ncbi:MarR family transcriptional regulator [Candidatus Rickettsia tasmanensis]
MKEIVNQLISKGRELLSKNEYKEALNIFTLIKQYKGVIHIYYYEGITYLCWGEYYNNVGQTDLYLKAVASL